MSARFEVRGAFPMQSRGVFVVHGALTDGMVRIGQIATGPGGFRARVHNVELGLAGCAEDIALTFPLPSAEQQPACIALQMAGGELELSET